MKSIYQKRIMYGMACIVIVWMLFAGGISIAAQNLHRSEQPPGFFRMRLGDDVITTLYDGYSDTDISLLQNASEKEIRALLDRSFENPAKLRTEVNAYVINTDTQTILVDSGAGRSFKPTMGSALDNFSAAGFRADQIDAVLITHMHPDHIGGLLNADGGPRFTKAVIYSNQKETQFWCSEQQAEKASEKLKPLFKKAREVAAPYQAVGKWKTFNGGQTLFTGIRALSAPGHSPGHSAFEVSSGQETLLIIGDVVHCPAVQLSRPEISVIWDIDPQQAIATRQSLFKQAADRQCWVGGMHFSFPGIGKLIPETSGGYRWRPVTFSQIQP